jgi:hypothetical protein
VSPDAEIIDNHFRWMKCWRSALANPNSEKAAQFQTRAGNRTKKKANDGADPLLFAFFCVLGYCNSHQE